MPHSLEKILPLSRSSDIKIVKQLGEVSGSIIHIIYKGRKVFLPHSCSIVVLEDVIPIAPGFSPSAALPSVPKKPLPQPAMGRLLHPKCAIAVAV